jgi:dihydrofolate synthase/folylpolyglutamate synthase
VLVLAVSADKDVRAMAAPLVGAFEEVIATRYAQERAMPPAALAEVVRAVSGESSMTVTAVESGLWDAVDRATAAAGDRGMVVVAGSLFAVGEVRPWFRQMPVDPIVVSDPAPKP